MIISKKIVDGWFKHPPSCFIDTKYGEKKTHTEGRRETRLGYYDLNIVSIEKAAKLSPFALHLRRTYIKLRNGMLRRITPDMISYLKEQLKTA